MPAPIDELRSRAAACTTADRARLAGWIRRLHRQWRRGNVPASAMEQLEREVDEALQRAARRRERLPQVQFPADLPITRYVDDIARAISEAPVTVVVGATGSGKSTQLPKICLRAGRGTAGLIGMTQPRRIAARTIAHKLSQELASPLGHAAGYKIRFSDRVSPESYVKVMTDGILLAEIQRQRRLWDYDTLILDEVHERSINIDFMLGYLRQLLRQRPDLKLVVTSATINVQQVADFFGGAPVVQVEGRTYPVETRYRPPLDEEADLADGILAAVDELAAEPEGDILVFLSGEREIRDNAEALRKHHPPNTEVLPLYARLSARDQERIFEPGPQRRIVLATNVAETSLTIPRIRHVIDSGTARISRYAPHAKIQRLPVERISRASADQRRGRCGRTAPGVCVRLYSEEDYLERPEFTEPELLRTNLAAVILRMKALDLGEVDDFPLLDRPAPKAVRQGNRALRELGALDEAGTLTDVGRELANMPVDPHLGRMVLEANRRSCLAEVLVIASALAIQDPRERPLDAQEQADAAHQEYGDPDSDFLSLLKLWRFFDEQRRTLAGRKLRRLCKERFLSFARMQEWREIHAQLKTTVLAMGYKVNTDAASYGQIHRSLLAGLLSNVALRQENGDYLGAHGTRLRIFPGSGLSRRGPKWLLAAETVETSRLFARCVAKVRPEWIEEVAGDLCRREIQEVYWDKRSARVMAVEQVTLFGLTVNARHRVHYGPRDPVAASDIFVREALVEGGYRSPAPFLADNRRLLERMENLEVRLRRRDVRASDNAIFDFYRARVPQDIYSGCRFEQWWREAVLNDPQLLRMTESDARAGDIGDVSPDNYPEVLNLDGLQLPLVYRFEPGLEEDGITAVVPLFALNSIPEYRLEWLVPGWLPRKIAALLKSLPKQWRRHFVPVPRVAEALAQALPARNEPLTAGLGREIQRRFGVEVPDSAWRPRELERYFTMRVEVTDETGRVLDCGRDLAALRARWATRAAEAFAQLPAGNWEREAVRRWDFGDLPQTVAVQRHGVRVSGYPALVEGEGALSVRVLDNRDDAERRHRAGLRALFRMENADRYRYLRKNLPELDRMCIYYAPLGSCDQLRSDLLQAIVDRALGVNEELIREEPVWRQRSQQAAGELLSIANECCGWVYQALELRQRVSLRIETLAGIHGYLVEDVNEQLGRLIYPGFISATPWSQLAQLPRYLNAVVRRLERFAKDPRKDPVKLSTVRPLWERFWQRAADFAPQSMPAEWKEFRWLLEELRVAMFAQELGTRAAVSEKRLWEKWSALTGESR